MDRVLGVSAIYLALVGIGYLVVPDAIMFGTLGSSASPALVGEVRIVASGFLGIALLNWLARGSEPSKARDAVVVANIVGFGLAAVLGLAAVATGAPIMELVPTAIAVVLAVAFIWARRETAGS